MRRSIEVGGGLINLCFAYLENKCKMQTTLTSLLHLNLGAFFRLAKMEEDPCAPGVTHD